jgi:hypothetical protein
MNWEMGLEPNPILPKRFSKKSTGSEKLALLNTSETHTNLASPDIIDRFG